MHVLRTDAFLYKVVLTQPYASQQAVLTRNQDPNPLHPHVPFNPVNSTTC